MRIYMEICVLALLTCNVQSTQLWWETMSLYQVYPRSFMDSDGDGIGDLKGIEQRLGHLVDSHIDAFWLSPIYKSPMIDYGYDASSFTEIDKIFGTNEDFENLVKAAHKRSLKVIMDFVPNHSSDQHDWFQKSVKGIEPYTDYYVWHKGHKINGTIKEPNNWRSVFGGSAWTWNEQRQAFYLHQFGITQPDLNYRNEKLSDEMKNILRFWMDKGVDGFRIDATPYIFEDERFLDEPLSGISDMNDYAYTISIYTKDQPKNYELMKEWRKVVDNYSDKVDHIPRVMMVEAYANISMTMKYYESGINFPFNFILMDIKNSSTAQDIKNIVDQWMLNMPQGATSNWVTGNHDNPRLVSRIGLHRALAVTTMALLLPGISVTYNGEEIGMVDTPINTTDPSRFRDPVRSPFQWDNSTSAGFSSNLQTWLPVNENYKTLNLEFEKAAGESYYNYYKDIASLRKIPSVRKGNLKIKILKNDILAFSRKYKGQKSVYVVINLNNFTQFVNLNKFEKTSSQITLYKATPGTDLISNCLIKSNKVRIPPNATVVLIAKEH
ncbi:alpha-glucosidase-like [Leptopilina heterotoma]|uniref:alpha-glucosidase-like n=1 Tax=Leptopilina heterotoma TaxID=63436 RepID=UPI001CA9C792|nr:alpha-glucosidase-like [Leptopilina heterotoma]XP_043470185.1 alpha-glucosidase-like [Leptopilina heterotoma]